MSDSGFSGLPPGFRPGNIPTADSTRPARHEIVRVVDTEGLLRDNARAQRLSGEVVGANRDGTIRIATAEGRIDIQKPRSHADLIAGARVEIDVPAGRPPRHIVIRDVTPPERNDHARAPSVQDATAPRVPARESNAPPAPTADAPPPVITTPARPPVDIPEQPATAPPVLRPAPLPPEQVVRLTPLPPETAAQIIRLPAQIAAVTLPAFADFTVMPPPVAIQTAPIQTVTIQMTAIQNAAAPLASPFPAFAPVPEGADGLSPQTAPWPAPSNAAPVITAATTAAAASRPLATPALTVTPPAAATLSLAPLPTAKAAQAFMMAMPENYIMTGNSAAMFTHNGVTSGVMIQGAATMDTPVNNLLTTNFFAAPLLATSLADAVPLLAGGTITPPLDAQIRALPVPTVRIGPPVAAEAPFTPSPPAMPTLPAQAGMIQGEVRGFTAQNLPVVTVNFPALRIAQDFLLQFPADNLATGSLLSLLPQGGAAPGAATAASGAAAGFTAMPFTPLPEFMTTGLWPALDEAFQALQQAAPQAAHMMAQTALPNAAQPQRLPAIALMFIAALKGGDLQGWLGEKTTDTLRRIGKADIVSRLARDGGTMARLSAAEQAAPQDWRSTAIPVLWDNHIHKAFLHFRHDREQGKDGDADKKNGTRFVVDIRPPRMGDVQLDGLHRGGEKHARLDMILRTRENISPAMQHTMRRLYNGALEQAAMTGELSFATKIIPTPARPEKN